MASSKLSLPRTRSKSSPNTSSSCSHHVPNSKEEDLRKVFRHFDVDGDGKVSSDELVAYFESIEEPMSREEAQRVMHGFDANGDNLLEFQEFVKLVEGNEDEAEDDLKRAFEMFEDNKGSGSITPKGLQIMFNKLGDAKSIKECVAMIRAFDLDGNGVLDFHEFRRMMTST